MSTKIGIAIFILIILVAGGVWAVLLWRGDTQQTPTTSVSPRPVEGLSEQEWQQELTTFEQEARQQQIQFDTQIRQLEQAR